MAAISPKLYRNSIISKGESYRVPVYIKFPRERAYTSPAYIQPSDQFSLIKSYFGRSGLVLKFGGKYIVISHDEFLSYVVRSPISVDSTDGALSFVAVNDNIRNIQGNVA